MQYPHKPLSPPGNTAVSRTIPLTSLPTDTLTAALLALDDLTTRLSVLALNASAHPDQSLRFRGLLSDLSDALLRCEEDLGTYADPDA